MTVGCVFRRVLLPVIPGTPALEPRCSHGGRTRIPVARAAEWRRTQGSGRRGDPRPGL